MSRRVILPIGPYHALQEEPEFFKLHVEGETVVDLDIELGYNHRGIEKLSESKDFEETIFLVERICGICSTSHPLACVQAIEDAGAISVRTLLERDHPEIESITSVCPAAEWIERELWELLGVQVRNHPDLRHLLLRDDWPAGKYPLRRDYEP